MKEDGATKPDDTASAETRAKVRESPKMHTPSEQTIFALYKMYTWVMTIENTTKNELERATNLLHDLAGEDIDAILWSSASQAC